jgi:Zn-dependent protease
MFDVTQPTPFDLRWRMFGIPVRVHPLFWLVAIMLGPMDKDTIFWVPVVFISILVHEFGHALVAKAFDWRPAVLLYSFGGLAFHDPHPESPGKRILVLLCGPFAQFVLAGFVMLYVLAAGWPEQERLELVIWYALLINVGWAVMNLLPVFPLDGGQIARTLFSMISPWNGPRWADGLTVAVAAGIAVLGWYLQQRYVALLFLILGIEAIVRLWYGGRRETPV